VAHFVAQSGQGGSSAATKKMRISVSPGKAVEHKRASVYLQTLVANSMAVSTPELGEGQVRRDRAAVLGCLIVVNAYSSSEK
jgi:hypothetical protein